jgi:protein ERP2
MNRVRTQLTKVRHIQDTLRAFEARDRNIAESNYVRVNSWSIIQIGVMLLVGLIQVRRAGLFLWFINGGFFILL